MPRTRQSRDVFNCHRKTLAYLFAHDLPFSHANDKIPNPLDEKKIVIGSGITRCVYVTISFYDIPSWFYEPGESIDA